jgi:hypothetical protein
VKRIYHGWIYAEKSPGMKDYFSIHVARAEGEPLVLSFGYGERGAAASVAYFEETMKLGRVHLERTPIGLRVFTAVKETEE